MRALLRHRVVTISLVVLAAVLLVGGGVILGWTTADRHSYAYTSGQRYPLLDPSVSDPGIHQEIINFDPLRQDLKNYLNGAGLDHSLYFEYLPNGVSIRDGADTSSTAASLMKVPIMMDLYKLSETGRLNLSRQVTVQAKDISTDLDYGDPTHLRPGDKLTLRQAAQITLYYSDNTTLNVVKDQIIPLIDNNTDSIQSLDLSYSLTGTTAGNESVLISARSYSSVLKCLYYACFNTPQDSTQIIQYLTGSAEPNRLAAGVGNGIKVAHKVGSSQTNQSDCGIIYYPGKPYLVCLMFLNLKPNQALSVDPYFQQVSRMIYDYVATSGGG